MNDSTVFDTALADTGDSGSVQAVNLACTLAEMPGDEHSGDYWWWGWLPDGITVVGGDREDPVLTDGHDVEARWYRDDPGASGDGWNQGYMWIDNDPESEVERAFVLVTTGSATECEITLY